MGTALITGGSRGMGRTTAAKFAREGHDVAITYRTRRDEAEAVVREVEMLGRGGLAVPMDVERRSTIDEAFAAVESRFGKIDYLFANAAIFPGVRALTEQTWEEWQRLLGVNVIGQWYCAKLAIENMRRHGGGGSVLYNSSISGVMTFPHASDYAASKHAVVGMAKSQSLECAAHGIRVNVLCPGFFKTEMYDENYGAATGYLTKSVIPAERIGDPEEIASLAYWILAQGTYCSGSVIVADGGITAGPKPQ
jgi:NAD(P)-dependent dehydrogenase (short-subunit alcohol dehydrogenase family)